MESFMKEYVLQKVRLKDQIIPFDLALQNADSQKQWDRSLVWLKLQLVWSLDGKVREEKIAFIHL